MHHSSIERRVVNAPQLDRKKSGQCTTVVKKEEWSMHHSCKERRAVIAQQLDWEKSGHWLHHSWIERRAVIAPQLDQEKSGHFPTVVLNIKPWFDIMIFVRICQIICWKKVQSDSPFPSAMLLITFNLLTSLFLNYFNIFKFFKSNFNKHFTKAFDTMFNDNIQNYRFTMHFCVSNINWKVDNWVVH